MTDKQAFIDAAQNDTRAKYSLPSVGTLVTEHEGDGGFRPYVVPNDYTNWGGGSELQRDILVADVKKEIYKTFSVHADTVEWSNTGGVWVVSMPVPTSD